MIPLQRLKQLKRRFYTFLRKRQVRGAEKNHVRSDRSIWDLDVDQRGHLRFGGCDVVEIAERFGTPLHIVDKAKLRSNYERFDRHLGKTGLDCHIYSSYKTNPVPAALRELHDLGAGAEVISHYELFLALHLGVEPDLIIYNGVNKTDESLRQAVEKNIKSVNINSFKEIEDVDRIARELNAPANVGARVCPRLGWGRQFGFKISSGEALEAFKAIRKKETLRIRMLHMHLGSGVRNMSLWVQSIQEVAAFMALLKRELGITFEYFDIGGGYGVSGVYFLSPKQIRRHNAFLAPYPGIRDRKAASYKEIAGTIGKIVGSEFRKHGLSVPRIILEPGRVLTSDTQMLVGRVGDIKTDEIGVPIALCDVGDNCAHPLGWEYHEILVANKAGQTESRLYTLAGPTCNPWDLLSAGRILPELSVGDYIAVLDSGAYFTPYAYNFSFPRPAIVMVSDGESRCIQRHETFDEMVSRDLPDASSPGGT